MRNSIYWLTIGCALLLGGLNYTREQYAMTAVMVVIALFYLGRMLVMNRREQQAGVEQARANVPRTSSQARKIVDDLRATEARLRANRQRNLLIGVLLMGLIGFTYSNNPQLAFAVAIFFLPLGVFIIKQTRMINEIVRGLAAQGY